MDLYARISKSLHQFATAGVPSGLPVARQVRLCGESALIAMCGLLPVLLLYGLLGAEVLLLLAGLTLLVQLSVMQLIWLGVYLGARVWFFLGNSLLVFLWSKLVGRETYVFLMYSACLIGPFAMFARSEVRAMRCVVAVPAVLVLVDVLLQVPIPGMVARPLEEQELIRWFVVPGTFLTCGAFLVLLLRDNRYAERQLRKAHAKLATLVTSLNDSVFEVNDSLRILNIWTSEDAKLPRPMSLYLDRTLPEVVPAGMVRLLTLCIFEAINRGKQCCFEYQSPYNNQWYEVKISRLMAGESGEQRVSLVLHNIHQERATRQQLRISDQIIRDNQDAILFLDHHGLIRSCNEAAERLYGYSRDELRGRSIELLQAPGGPGLPVLGELAEQSQGWRGEILHRRRNGSLFDAQLTISVLGTEPGAPLGYALIVRDVSTNKAAQELLRLSERRFRSMVDHAPGAIFEWYTQLDGSGWGFNYISSRIQEMTGHDPEEVLRDANLLVSMVHPDDQEAFHHSVMEASRMRAPWNHQMRIIKDGEVRWLHGISTPIGWNRDMVLFHGILLDITEQRRHQQELTRAKEEAEEASRAKAEFLSIMSHEIRTPMNAIIGLTHILLEENPRPDQFEHLRTLRFSAESLLALINDILDFNKIEIGKIRLEQVDFDLRQLLEGVARAFSYSAQEKGLQLREVIDYHVPRWVIGDPTRLNQILGNLLSNAIKFTHQGLVELSVKRLDDHATGLATLEFRITDSGIGIAEDKRERIFEFFTQADESITRSYGGTGLGLAITRALVQLYGSELKLESEVGAGSSFHFQLTLPYRSGERTLPRIKLPQMGAPDLTGYRILLVEDNPVNVMVAVKLLRKWGAEVDTAENGFEALERVSSRDYHLVLMDIQMPLKDGYAATREIRALPDDKYRRLPIVALSAATTEDVRLQALRCGMDGFLAKPINPGELKVKILRFLEQAESLAG